MEITIFFALIGIIITIAGAVWGFARSFRKIEIELQNHATTERAEMRKSLEIRIDRVELKVDKVTEAVVQLSFIIPREHFAEAAKIATKVITKE